MRLYIRRRPILPRAIVKIRGVADPLSRHFHDQRSRIHTIGLIIRCRPNAPQPFACNLGRRGKSPRNCKGDMAYLCIPVVPDPAFARGQTAIKAVGIVQVAPPWIDPPSPKRISSAKPADTISHRAAAPNPSPRRIRIFHLRIGAAAQSNRFSANRLALRAPANHIGDLPPLQPNHPPA